jgi:hypothetical protein
MLGPSEGKLLCCMDGPELGAWLGLWLGRFDGELVGSTDGFGFGTLLE